ncbi:MAG: PAS domain S-box protein [Desulfobacterales bacterium]
MTTDSTFRTDTAADGRSPSDETLGCDESGVAPDRNLRVLVIEDSEDDALLLLRALHRSGWAVESERVDTAGALIASLADREWDIVISDYQMPQFDGLHALRIVRQHAPDLPFIVLSGAIGEEIAVATMKAGAHDYLMKDNLARLAPAISRELKEAGIRRAHRRAEAAQRESEQRYRSLFQNNHAVMLLIDPATGEIINANSAACDYYGYTMDEIIHLNVTDINILPPDQVHLEMQSAQTTKRRRFFFKHRLADGRIRDVEVFSGPIFVEGRALLYSIVHDVTERKQAEEALRESEEQYRLLFEAASDGLVLHPLNADREHSRFVRSNSIARRMLGYRSEEMLRLSPIDIQAPDDESRMTAEIEQMLRERKLLYEKTLVRKDGRRFPAEINSTVFEFRGQTMVLSIIRDITERKEAARRLEQENREIALVNRILRVFTEATEDDLFDQVLEIVLEGLSSRHGVFGYIAEPGHLMCPSLTKMLDSCEVPGKCIHYPPEKWKGLWARAIRQKRSFYTNSPMPVPAGHPEIHNNLAAPILFKGKAIGLLNLANKEGGYEERDRVLLESMAERIAPQLYAWIQKRLREEERAEADRALRERESFFRQTLESIPGMVFTTRPDGYCDYQSQQWVDYTGVPMSEHLGHGWARLLHPEDRARALAAWEAAVEGSGPYDLEYRVRRRDGEYEWFKVIGRPIRSAKGEIVRWFGAAMNIEDLKRTEAALHKSEQRYRTLFETMTEGFALHETILDEAGRPCDYRFLDVNPAFERLTGLKHPDLIGKRVLDVMPDTEPYWVEGFGRVALTGEPLHFENFSSELGRWYEVFAYRTAPGQFAVVFSDITDRKQAENDLRQLNEFLEHRVFERTAELERINEALRAEIERRHAAEKSLQKKTEELKAHSDSLVEVNTALRVLLKQREEDRKELEEKVLCNVKDLVMPNLSKLAARKLGNPERTLLEVIESNLEDITSPLARRMSLDFARLSPNETQVANMVRQGRTTKEIAELMGVATSTIDSYRNSIRDKLGLRNKGINLKSYLTSIS